MYHSNNQSISGVACPNIAKQVHITPIFDEKNHHKTMTEFVKFVEYVNSMNESAVTPIIEIDDSNFYCNYIGVLCSEDIALFQFSFFPDCELHFENEEQVLRRLYDYRDGFFNGPDAQHASHAYCALYPQLFP